MRERLITLACALGALALFLTMFLRGSPTTSGSEIARPTTAESGPNGYEGAVRWLEAEGVHTTSLRDPFNRLNDLAAPASGNLLVVTLPATISFKTREFTPLDRWVRAGNTLLVLAALDDKPDWSQAFGALAVGDLNILTGVEFETVRVHARRFIPLLRRFDAPHPETLVANRAHPYFDGVRQAVALSDYPSQIWVPRIPYDAFILALGHDAQTGESALWTRPLGRGRIIVSAYGSLFTNRALGLDDNGRLLANIVAGAVEPRGHVIFDDAHQGLTAAYDPEKFYRDPRLYRTLGVLALLWLIWVLGATRLRMPVSRNAIPSETDLLRATGGFLARALQPAAAARCILEHFLQRAAVKTHVGRPDAAEVWQRIERHPGITASDIRQLQGWHSAANAARRVPLRRLHNVIVRVERHLSR
ncbi:MAG TPA: DUF4350 domain-containing protein [Steroidobacteraceae bacterium]|nr:DUF4350 domain-containing protein [Steroidobacteraceae bacterium]